MVLSTKLSTTDLGFIVCDRWVPKQFTQLHKQRLDIFQTHFDLYGNELDIFLNRIKWFKSQPSAGKLILTVLGLTRLSAGTIREWHNNKQGALQNEMLTDKLKPAIRSKR
ncbi:hypothetical protein LAZ67_10001985 [Cordylochernes scorpioides]|uniref:Transposase n=1 Tax=Cordylochernes scorpioides TaxID=51811 RepID=A0ABY6KZ23_9ARAC|nr:hypothetical protein LAZ67_10001985 [Cordylochernes scorpioides]